MIQTGNAVLDATENRGWLIGDFVAKELGLRHTDKLELKWGTHKAGEAREDWTTDEKRTTTGILISGKFEMEFRDQKYVFEKPGDYVMWGPGIDHKWRAIEDCIWLTLRWFPDNTNNIDD